jgi:hypothetical protein
MIVEVVVCGCAVICTLSFVLWLRHNSGAQSEHEPKGQPKQKDKQDKKWGMA